MATHSVLLPGKTHGRRSLVGCSPWGHEELDMTEWLPFHFSLSSLGEGKAPHSSVFAWRIPGTGEPAGLPFMGSRRVGHDWCDLAAAASFTSWVPLDKRLTSSSFRFFICEMQRMMEATAEVLRQGFLTLFMPWTPSAVWGRLWVPSQGKCF